MSAVGQSIPRREGPNKVSGAAKYNDDFSLPSLLHGALVTSERAHAGVFVDASAALAVPGVRAVVTGEDVDLLCGEVLNDRPPLARGKVRYYGEPLAIVIAHEERAALRGARKVRVSYRDLPVVNSVGEAVGKRATLIHEALGDYEVAQRPVAPEPGTNVADRARVRKGDAEAGFRLAEVTVEGTFSLPQVDHAAMETRSARAEILPDGRVVISAATQGPYEIQKLFARWFDLDPGQIIVNVPLVGGAFGGKAAVQLEVLAYIASRAVHGRPVRIANSREQDITSSPVGIGLEATAKLGAKRDGTLVAFELTAHVDAGAYADSAPRMARAIASECTGPYRVDHVKADVLVVYTNHTYVTAWRGFGHLQSTFVAERMLEKLARKLGRDPLDLREQNLLQPGDTTPTGVTLTRSQLGDPATCISELRRLLGWEEGDVVDEGQRVRSKGTALFWKTSTSDPNSISGAILTLNANGTVNVSTGAVEFGPGTKTTIAQIVADALNMDVGKVHVRMAVNTRSDPVHWKTVASMATYMIGRAVLNAAGEVARKLKEMATLTLRCPVEDLEIGDGRVYLRDDPSSYVEWKDIAHGYSYPDGDSVGGQVMGEGAFIMRHLTPLDPDTGRGRPGPAWTVGAQGVEIELDKRTHTYRLIRAATVLDAGRVVNPGGATGAVKGGMCMGLGYATREAIRYDAAGRPETDQFRTYKVMRFGEEPERYDTAFVETPQEDSAFGARAVGEHGVLAIPAAFANAVSRATGKDFDHLPITPEEIWKAAEGRA